MHHADCGMRNAEREWRNAEQPHKTLFYYPSPMRIKSTPAQAVSPCLEGEGFFHRHTSLSMSCEALKSFPGDRDRDRDRDQQVLQEEEQDHQTNMFGDMEDDSEREYEPSVASGLSEDEEGDDTPFGEAQEGIPQKERGELTEEEEERVKTNHLAYRFINACIEIEGGSSNLVPTQRQLVSFMTTGQQQTARMFFVRRGSMVKDHRYFVHDSFGSLAAVKESFFDEFGEVRQGEHIAMDMGMGMGMDLQEGVSTTTKSSPVNNLFRFSSSFI